jgi:hypothetical protein
MLENPAEEIPLMRALVPLLFAGALAVAQPRDAPPPENGGLVVPEGYVLQVLGATDGRIAMPKDWFCRLKDMDIVAVSTFGAPPEKWDAVANITKVMSEFMLIGKNPGNSN